MKNYKENYDYYNVEKVDSIKQLLESAAADAGDKIAFKYKENKEISENELGINEDVNNVEKANENQPRNYITPSYPKYQPIKNEVEYRPIERNLDNEVEIKNSDNKNEILREDSIKIN